MSYRDLRNFTEMMRCLGYPRLISMENFKTPNFELIAEILKWLIQRYDYNSAIPPDIDSEQDRVIFIKSVAQFIAEKAHIKLNTKRLYQADGYAVKEILKFATLLYNAMKEVTNSETRASGDGNTSFFDIASNIEDLKTVRQISSEVAERGANLYQLLSNEVELREARTMALAQPLEINKIEKKIRNTITSSENEIKKTLKKLDNAAADEANLEAKIAKRKAEVDRTTKRLGTLQTVRPAFMDEFERLEEDLKHQYDEYMIKFRNMTFLEHQMSELKQQELAKFSENETVRRRIQNRLREEEKTVILSNPFGDDNPDVDLVLDDDDEDDSESTADIPPKATRHNRGAAGAARPQNHPARPRAAAEAKRGMYVDESEDEEDDTMTTSEDIDVDDGESTDQDLMMGGGRGERRHDDEDDGDILDDDDF